MIPQNFMNNNKVYLNINDLEPAIEKIEKYLKGNK
jgi:hypothetical protein